MTLVQIKITRPAMWMVQHDLYLPKGVRPPPPGLNGCPEIFRFSPDHSIELTRERQLLIRDINPRMTPKEISKFLGSNYALCNNHGVGDEDHPRRNYITGEDLDADENPVMPSCFVMGGAILQELNAVDGWVYPRYIDVNKPLPSAQQVLAEHLYYVIVNVYYPSGNVGGVPASLTEEEKVPLFARYPIKFPVSSYDRGLVKVDVSKPLPSPYLKV